jgi:RimJ/RimL family protein N-acetyltransferase
MSQKNRTREDEMIHELTAANYDKVKTLYEPLTFMPFCAGVLEGGHDGRVFVDDLRQPRTAFMLTWGCWGYLAGDPENAGFLQALNEALFAKAFLDKHAWGLFLSCPPDGWAAQLAAVCAPRPPIELPRRHYVARSISDDWQTNVPEGYAMRRMDKSLLDLAGIALPGDVKGMIDIIDWNADVVQKGCGFVAVYDGQIAAQAMIDCVVGDVGEIGLFTHPAHRRRGLATATSSATIEYGLTHGLSRVVWDCYEHNVGSVRTAVKLGLERERDHTMYSFLFDEADHWSMMGWHDADRGLYRRTLDTCERLFSGQADPPELAYVAAARAWAAMDAPDRAFAYLNRAIDSGWDYAPDLESTEFDRLHGTPEWQALVRRLDE